MDSAGVYNAIRREKPLDKVNSAIKKGTVVWNNNRKILIDLMIENDVDAAAKNVKLLPKQIDQLSEEIMKYRMAILSVAFSMGN